MIIKTIESQYAPAPVGPYSPALQVGDFLFISGQIPLTTTGNLVTGHFEDETRQVLKNIEALLHDAGLDFTAVVKIGIFTTDLTQFDLINQVYSEFVTAPFPARAAVQVAALPKGARIEMEAMAYVK
jgi:2-iminobutanoate/2-iminopropanoate deaminase